LDAAQKWVNQQQEAGLDFNMLDRQDLRNESNYFADDLYGGLECQTDATVNPYMLTYSLFHNAKKQGAKIHTKTEVKNLYKHPENKFVIETSKETFIANIVINACVVWAPVIGKMLDVSIQSAPRRGQRRVADRSHPEEVSK